MTSLIQNSCVRKRNKNKVAINFATLLIFLLRLELVFAYATDGAYPIIGDILKGCSWLDATIGISYCGVIDVTAYFTNVLHNLFEF